MENKEFQNLFLQAIDNGKNNFHPLVLINGKPEIGVGTTVGFFSEINAKEVNIVIGNNCDIASFVAINAADSHRRCIELDNTINREDIIIENNVFIGSHSVILGGSVIGHHTVIAAGTVVRNRKIPPFSLVIGDKVKSGYYKSEYSSINK
jgi:acetyltransferase-like isoleucine patch superfamily enzyme